MAMTSRDPLDVDVGDDPEVVKAQEKAYKETLMVHNDPNLGVEENEEQYQQALENFCEYLKKEYNEAIANEAKRQIEGFDEDENVDRRWIPADQFGQRGDFRKVSIAYSYQREKLTSKIGVPGHPAPALQRWRERKTVESRKLDWTEMPMASEKEILGAEYESVEEEEEAIIKLLSVKYQNIEKRKVELANGGDASEVQARADAGHAANRVGQRMGAAPEVGPRHAVWSILSHQFPKAEQFYPTSVHEGDSVIPFVRGADVFAWQRERRRREETARNVAVQLALAEEDVPVHRFRQRLEKEDVDRSHAFVMSIIDPAWKPPAKAYMPPPGGRSGSTVAGPASGKDKGKPKKAERRKPLSQEEKEERAAAAKVKAAEKVAKRQAREAKEVAKAEKAAKRQAKHDAAVAAEAEALKAAAKAAEEKARKKGFLPRIFSYFGGGAKKEDEEDEENEPEAVPENLDLVDGAAWARAYRESYEVLLTEKRIEQCEDLLEECEAADDTFAARMAKRVEAYKESLTDEASPFITQVGNARPAAYETALKATPCAALPCPRAPHAHPRLRARCCCVCCVLRGGPRGTW